MPKLALTLLLGFLSLDVVLASHPLEPIDTSSPALATQDSNEFLAVQEDILLRGMKVMEQAGTGFAFPSHTLYLGRDGGLDDKKQLAAEKQVGEWASAQTLPFPDFPEGYRQQITDTLDYPPEGSPGAD